MWIKACREEDLAPGGVRSVCEGGEEVAVCNVGGAHFAVGRRCGHMNAPLEEGALDGPYLTCPLHFVRFDVRTGEALNPPVEHNYGRKAAPEPYERIRRTQARLESRITTHDLPTYPVRVRDGVIEVDVPQSVDGDDEETDQGGPRGF